MPLCSRCGVDQPPDAFSEESHPLCETCYQIELEEEAAGGEIPHADIEDVIAQEGVDQDMDRAAQVPGEGSVPAESAVEKPHKPVPLSNVARLLNADGELIEDEEDGDDDPPPDIGQLDDLVNAIEAREYSNGFGLDSRSVLRIRLKRVFFEEENPVVHWLTRPLVQALIEGPNSQAMKARVVPLNMKESVMEGQSLLHWLVQWRLLQIQCGWRGHDDMVDLLIRAGADVNATLQNGCTPLFFAVKYGTIDTVRCLIQGGANPLHKDIHNQTCLRNALPQASPYILKYLLQHIPANETFTTELYNGSKTSINALDVMVTEFVTPHPDVSWATLGMPSMADYACCMLLLMKKGVLISPHYPDVTYFLGEYIQGSIQNVKRMYYTRKVADLLLGQWLPMVIREETTMSKEHHKIGASSRKCGVCHSDMPVLTTSLYCGHSFCRDCILGHSQSQKASEACCPVCHLPLCQDLKPTLQSTTYEAPKSIEEERHALLSQLSLKQLQFECEARNIVVADKDNKDHCVQAICADWNDFTLSHGMADDDPGSRLMAELTLSHTMISQDNYLWVAPAQGSVLIPIIVKGVPIFALLSTTSPYTMVSPRLVQQFGFKTNSNLQSTQSNAPLKFVRAEDDDQKNGGPVNNNPNLAPAPPTPKVITAPQMHWVALQDFAFELGKSGIEVRLPSAVQVSEPHTQDWPVGVVLGLDFIESASWVQVSVEADLEVCLGRTVALLTSNQSRLEFDLVEPKRANLVEEDLRYYAKDGKMWWTPLWHVSLSQEDSCLSAGQHLQRLLPYPDKRKRRDDKTPRHEQLLKAGMTECAWCCREFPFVPQDKQRDLVHWILSRPLNSGMVQCPLCAEKSIPTFYCDENCRRQAMAIHSYCQHEGADLSCYNSEEGVTSKRKLGVSLALIILIAVLVNFGFGAGEQPLQNEAPNAHDIPYNQGVHVGIDLDGIESEL